MKIRWLLLPLLALAVACASVWVRSEPFPKGYMFE